MANIAPPAPRSPIGERVADEHRMKNRVVRVDDVTWNAAKERAARDNLPMADVIRHYLREYAAGA